MAASAFRAVLTVALCRAVLADQCPNSSISRSIPAPNLRGSVGHVRIDVMNNVNEEMLYVWVSFEGKEKIKGSIKPLKHFTVNTFPGHLHRFYTQKNGVPVTLHLEYQVPETLYEVIDINACGGSETAISRAVTRAAEFEHLSFPENDPCDPTTDSSKWSCMRFLSIDDVAKRDPEQYGFHKGEGMNGKITHETHDTVDTTYVKQIREVPKVTPSGPGYKRMKFSEPLLQAKAWWDTLDPTEKQGIPERIGGGVANLGTNITNLDHYRKVQLLISEEMQDLMQWWTGLRLTLSATYGVRTYRRDNVLVDHVDRAENRIVCGIMQMSQTTDPNGGWPLEVLLPNGTVGEIFLQPGELVLLESAWLMHGRPMRFRGTNYSIVIVHFRPIDWDITEKLKGNRYYGVPEERFTTLADKGYVKSDAFSWPSAVWDFASASLTRLWESCRA